jgi:hypothetical protein
MLYTLNTKKDESCEIWSVGSVFRQDVSGKQRRPSRQH